MDLQQFSRVNEKAKELQLAHARVRHRFLIPIEHQHLSKELGALFGISQFGDDLLLQKRGILVRHQIFSRLESLPSAPLEAPQTTGSSFQGTVSSLKSSLSTLLSRLSQEESTHLETSKSTCNEIKSVESKLQKVLLDHGAFVSGELKDRETRSSRILALQRKRSHLVQLVAESQRELDNQVVKETEAVELQVLKDQSAKLGRMVDRLIEAMPLLQEAWSLLYGPEEARIFLHTLQAFMNDCLKSSGGVEITENEEDCHFLSYLFQTGLIRSHPTDFGKTLLNFAP